ncbi:MAG: glycosyltransferase family 39 protein, partial [Anaerolineales bacterium]|nr:glycosyltransferase family 39 protein [Anaerolineales bacterium]
MSTRLFLSRWGWWFFLLAALTTAVFLRFYQLGDLPPGLYGDEAYNGLDALRVLDGETPLFFSSNNGREPAYIYLTAVSIALLGNTPLAVRLSAAVVGALTVLPVFALATTWFGRRTGLLAAWLWAATLWPMHLSRIGLRAILLLPLLALAFWLGTLAWRQQKAWLWVAAGVAYGLGFYTYLPIRFTPLLLVVLAVLIWWRGEAKRLWPGALWFGLSTAVVLTPWLLLWFQQPDLILGRSGQVSILNPAINGGNLPLALLENSGRALGMFLWQGDDILRHNPALRPVFDWLMIVPFLWGLFLLGRQWRRLTAVTTLLWVLVMLGPTILAEDTPH